MNIDKASIIIAALRALPSENMRKEEMFAVECALKMAVELAVGMVAVKPNDDAATIRELTVECIARARRIDELEKEVAGLLSDNGRIGIDREMAIDAIKDGINVTDALRKELDEASDRAEDWRLKAGQRSIEVAQAHRERDTRLRELDERLRYAQATIIELEKERTILNRDCFNLSIELDIERKKVGELFRDIAIERDLVGKLMAENARLQRDAFKPATFRIGDIPNEGANMFERGEMASSGWGDIPHEVKP